MQRTQVRAEEKLCEHIKRRQLSTNQESSPHQKPNPVHLDLGLPSIENSEK
jgi:hypothetical protein